MLIYHPLRIGACNTMRSRYAIAVVLGCLLTQTAAADWLAARGPAQGPVRQRLMQAPRGPVAGAPAWRNDAAPPPAASYFQPQRRSLSVGDVAQRAQQMNGGGRVLSVDPHEQGYRVKLLKDGEVRVITVPQ